MAKKPGGLGKGLDALFIETGIDEKGDVRNASEVTKVRLSDIEPDKNQPRKAFNEEALQVLADSLHQCCLLLKMFQVLLRSCL